MENSSVTEHTVPVDREPNKKMLAQMEAIRLALETMTFLNLFLLRQYQIAEVMWETIAMKTSFPCKFHLALPECKRETQVS